MAEKYDPNDEQTTIVEREASIHLKWMREAMLMVRIHFQSDVRSYHISRQKKH